MSRTAILVALLGVAAAALGLALAWLWLAASIGDDLGRHDRTREGALCRALRGLSRREARRSAGLESPLPSGRMPAPPHDASGHTWHHPDDVLFRITKEGPAAVVGRGYQSDMPGFGNVMSDEEIHSVLAFIKSTWPEEERRYQAEMNRREREPIQ